MKRKVILLVAVLSVFFLVGCKDTQNKEESLSNNPTEANSNQEDIKTNVEELKNLPKYFMFFDYIDYKNYVGLTKNKLFKYSIKKQELDILSEKNYWNIKLSPNKKLIAWNNEDGLGLYDLENKSEELILSNEEIGEIQINDYIWSSDSQRMLLVMDKEFGFSHGIFDIKNKTIGTLENKGIMRAVEWVDNTKILFERFYMESKNGEKWSTDSAFRTDLVLYDMNNNQFTSITDNGDGEFVRVLGKKDNIVYFINSSDTRKELFTLELNTTKFEKLGEVEGEVLAIRDKNSYITAINKGNDELGNSNFELHLVSKGNSYRIGELKSVDSNIQAFLFEDFLFLSFNYGEKTEGNQIITKYRAEMIKFE